MLLEEAYERNYLYGGSRALSLLMTGLDDLERQAVEKQGTYMYDAERSSNRLRVRAKLTSVDTGGASDSEVPRITSKRTCKLRSNRTCKLKRTRAALQGFKLRRKFQSCEEF